AGVGEVEEVLRGALAIADAALRPHTIAVFLLSPDGESVRLRECASKSDRLFRGPLSSREGALGAVLSTQSGVRLEEGAAQLTYYEDRAPVPCFCGVPLQERGGRLIGALAADRATPFTPEEQRVLEALANEVTRAVEAERLLGAVRKEKEEKARFFRALEELNKSTTPQQAAEARLRTRLYEQAEHLATTDGLTGLLNRRTFNAQLQGRLREAQRYNRPLSLLLLDVDHFKKVNDTFGHPTGDAVLKGIAAVAQKQARETDIVARYGGEEMALILPETDAFGAHAIAERIRKAVGATSHPTEQGAIQVTVSIGLATSPPGDSAEAVLEAADKALYRAKQGGRNRVVVANPASPGVRGDLRSLLPGSPG